MHFFCIKNALKASLSLQLILPFKYKVSYKDSACPIIMHTAKGIITFILSKQRQKAKLLKQKN